jgi:hypothetical protein
VAQRFSRALLRSLRNDLSINEVIRRLCELPWKERDGYCRFLCPRCREFHTATNAKTNLARCFRCRVNFNPIEIVMEAEGCAFVDAVNFLSRLLEPQGRRSDQRLER